MGLLSLFRKWNVTIMTQFKKISVPICIKTFGGTALSIIFIWWTIVSFIKVKKILKGSLGLIQSPSSSVKIQIMDGKVCLRCKGKTLLGIVNKLLKTKSLLKSPSNVLLYYFSANNLNLYWRWRWWNQIQTIFWEIQSFTELCSDDAFLPLVKVA